MPASNEVSLKISVDDQGSKVLIAAIRQLEKLQKSVKDTSTSFKSIQRSTAELDKALKSTTSSSGRFDKQLDRVKRDLDDVRRSTGRAEESMLDYAAALGSVASGLRSVADFGTRQLTGFVQSASRLEDITSGFTSILGSADKARGAIDKLRVAAQDPGLSFETAATATRRFTAYNVELNDAIRITRGFAQAARVAGTSNQDLEEGLRQLGKAIGNNKIEADDLSSILERFGPIGTRLREEFGKTGDDITKSLEAAGKSVADLAIELADLDKIPKASADTLSAAISNLGNEFQRTQQILGERLLPAVKAVVEALTDLLKAFNDLPKPLQNVALGVGLISTALAGIGAAVLTAAAGIAGLLAAFGGAGAGGLAALSTAAAAGLGKITAAASALSTPVLSGAGAITALFVAIHELNNTLEAQVAREGGLGTIESATIKADDAAKGFTITLNLTKSAMDEVARSAKNVETDVEALAQSLRRGIGYAAALARISASIPPDRSRPIRRLRGPALGTLTDAPTGQPTPEQLFANRQLFIRATGEIEKLNERASKAARESWGKFFTSLTAGLKGTSASFRVTSQNVLRTIGTASKAASNATRKRLADDVDAATRQKDALGNLADITRRFYETSEDRVRRLRREQQEYIHRVYDTADAFQSLSLAFRRFGTTGNRVLDTITSTLSKLATTAAAVANILGAISEIRADRASGSSNALSVIGNIVGIISSVASVAALFHDPANDRIAELVGARLGGSIPVGSLRAIRRQNARDFSESFARGVERQNRQFGIGTQEPPIDVHIALQVGDRTTQEIVKQINRMEQSGRTQLIR